MNTSMVKRLFLGFTLVGLLYAPALVFAADPQPKTAKPSVTDKIKAKKKKLETRTGGGGGAVRG